MRRIVFIASLAAFAAALLSAQASRQNTMEVSIVVTGKGGAPIEDLTQEEVTIKDNGKKQEILSFAKVTPGSPAEQGKPAIHNIALIDCLNTTYRDLPENRLEMLKTIAELSKGDNMVVLMLRDKLRVVSDPSDAAGLLRKFAAQGTKDLEAKNLAAYDWVFNSDLGLTQLFTPAGVFDRRQVEDSLGTLRMIASNMQPRSGRKNLYWISQGFPLLLGGPAGLGGASLDKVAGSKGGTQGTDLAAYAKDMDVVGRMLNNANVAVYPIDSRYLAVNDTSISDKAMMEDLAKVTGGVAYTSRRDVANATREAIGDSKVVYVVRYAISDLKPDGKFHAVKVDTTHKDAKLRYREGYYAPQQK